MSNPTNKPLCVYCAEEIDPDSPGRGYNALLNVHYHNNCHNKPATADELIALVIEHQKNQSRINKKPELSPPEAKQQLRAAMETVISPDENDTREDGEIMRDAVMRNRLRAEQRQRADAFLGTIIPDSGKKFNEFLGDV